MRAILRKVKPRCLVRLIVMSKTFSQGTKTTLISPIKLSHRRDPMFEKERSRQYVSLPASIEVHDNSILVRERDNIITSIQFIRARKAFYIERISTGGFIIEEVSGNN